MKACRFFLQRPFGGKPCTTYALNLKDVKEFFVKVYYKENVWEDRLKEDNPFDSDLNILNVEGFMNGALVDFKCDEWLLNALEKRYEINNIEIEGERYLRKTVNGKWKYIKE